MAESKVFKLIEGLDAAKVGRGIEHFLRDKKNLIVEGTPTPEGYFVQAKEESNWKKAAGMDLATQIQIIQMNELVTVEVGSGKWADKIGAGAIGMVVFAPLAITAVAGAWGQKKLPGEIFTFVEQFIMSGGKNVTVSMSISRDSSKIICPSCGASVDKGTKFCPSCGGKLANTCPSCGASIDLNAKFWPECGTSTVVKKYCPKCNREVGADENFCPGCGSPLNGTALEG